MIGGNAVAAWVARADPSATRTTKDVEVGLIGRAVREALPPELRERLVQLESAIED